MKSARSPAPRRSASPSPHRCPDSPRSRRRARSSRCCLRTARTRCRVRARRLSSGSLSAATVAHPSFAAFAADLTHSARRGSLRCFSRNATGSAPTDDATSSMIDSCANEFCSRSGERSGPVQKCDRRLCESTRSLAIVPVPPRLPADTADHIRRRDVEVVRVVRRIGRRRSGRECLRLEAGKKSGDHVARDCCSPGGRRGRASTLRSPTRRSWRSRRSYRGRRADRSRTRCRSSPTPSRPCARAARAPVRPTACDINAASNDTVSAPFRP